MKTFLAAAVVMLSILSLDAREVAAEKRTDSLSRNAAAEFDAAVAAQPKLLRLSAVWDGSGRIIFTRKRVRYEHKHWGRPSKVLFDGEPWIKHNETPAAWKEIAGRLDLTKARIVERHGRDVIALEHTPDGFDLYISDSPNGAAIYSITIAIPRRP